MATKRDYYEVLGVGRGASEDEIRKAFRRLARQCHPDVNRHDGAEARFKEINEAYEVLGDPEKRRGYDRFGHAGAQGFDGAASGTGGFGHFGFEDIFETFFGGSGATSTRRGPQRGADLRYDLHLSFEEAIFGCEKDLELPRLDACPTCNGSGAEPGTQPVTCTQCNGTGELRRMQQSLFGQLINVVVCDRCAGEGRVVTTPCQNCHGRGRVQSVRRLRVSIPPGIEDGTQIRLTGEGEAGPKGGRPGNLFVVLSVAEHPQFKRQGNDLTYELTINMAQAALGDEVAVPNVDGTEVKLRIPPSTQSGKTLRIKERGVPHLRGSGRGDMLVHVRVATPSHLTDEQRALLYQLAKSFGTPISTPDGRNFFDKVKDAFGVD